MSCRGIGCDVREGDREWMTFDVAVMVNGRNDDVRM